MKKKVLVGMSGGVDSSVAAYLLKEQGYEVIGVTMKFYEYKNNSCDITREDSCCGLSAIEDARRVADILSIPLYTLNYKQEFKDNVIDNFVSEYKNGNTPNPCVRCNRYVRFPNFLKKANELGVDYISTGHYSIIDKKSDGLYHIYKSKEKRKDQTYMLYGLTQEILERTLMPLGIYSTKEEVRSIAKKINVDIAKKRDSQEICFIEDNNHARFIKEYTSSELTTGFFKTKDNKIIARHNGIENYTIGQRKGLGISLGKPAYIVDIVGSDIIVSNIEDLYKDSALINNINFISNNPVDKLEVTVKVRYSSNECEASLIKKDKDLYKVEFKSPQKSVTRGQSIVFYKGEELIGGGVIIK